MQSNVLDQLDQQSELEELHLWIVEDYHQMIEMGILTADSSVELLEGKIVRMSPQRPFHASSVHRCNKYLSKLLGDRAEVRVQLPVTLGDDSEPEPDIAVVCQDVDEYSYRHPEAKDIFLLIEVADSTFSKDRNLKSRIYAKNRVLEYWILDLQSRQVYVFRKPEGETYQIELLLKSQESTTLQAFLDVEIFLDFLFPVNHQ
jgi:Uma2 family endonuclease